MITLKTTTNTGLIHFPDQIAWDKRPFSHSPIISAQASTLAEIQEFGHLLPDASRGQHIKGSGTDPEIFVKTKSGKCLPAFKFLEEKPARHPGGASVFWDGFQAEMNFAGAISCHESLVDHVQVGLKSILAKARVFDPSAELAPSDIIELDPADLDSADDKYVILGCAPSCNPYNIEPLQIENPRQHLLRYSGTHLHYGAIGHTPSWFPFGTVIAMDKILGVILTALGRGWEDPRRRLAYGRPGEHRVPESKPAGTQPTFRLEYRTPGSFLLRHPALLSFAADIGRLAFQIGCTIDGRDLALPDASKLIMACDADAAVDYIQANKKFFENLLLTQYGEYTKFLRMLTKGAANLAPFTSYSVAGNWNLDSPWNYNRSIASLVRNSL